MKEVKVLFVDNMPYGDLIFLKDKVYLIRDTKDGFLGRCIKRHHQIVEDAKDCLPDLRFSDSIKEEIKEEKPVIVEEKPVVELVEPVEVAVDEKEDLGKVSKKKVVKKKTSKKKKVTKEE